MTTQTMPEIKSVADAIDQGVALAATSGAPPAPPADDDANGGTDNDDSTQDLANSGGNDQAPDSAASADGAGAGSDADAGAGTDDAAADAGDGTPDAAGDTGDGDDADAAADSAQDGDKEVKASKEPDHYNDPIPNALKPATKERIRFLANEAKTYKERAESAATERDELITAVTETGATPEQYAGMLDYLSLVNSNDRNKQIAAINFMYREMAALSRVAGIRVPGITNLSGFPDLEKQVAEGKLSQELAEELAATRSAQAHQGRIGAAQQSAAKQRQAYQVADSAAREEMNALEASFAKNDPLYTAKKPMIVELLNEVIRGDKKQGIPPLHPSKWPAAYKKIYESLPKTLGGMRPVARPSASAGNVPKNQPLRAQQPAGAQRQEPKSLAEALDMGIELARGG